MTVLTAVMGAAGGVVIWSYLDGLTLNALFIEVFLNKSTFFLVGLYLALLVYVLIIYASLYAINTFYFYRKCKFCKKRSFFVFSGGFTLLVLGLLAVLFNYNFISGIFILILAFLVLAMRFLVNDYPGSLKELKKAEANQIIGLGLISFFILITSLYFFVNLQEDALKRLGFIQRPDDAAWYALDMNYLENFGFQYNCAECSSSAESDNNRSLVEKLKLVFVEETANKDQPAYINQKNTLYGYFIWNVGETRVFCPKSIKIGKVKEKQKDKQNDKQNGKQNLSSCLVINKDKIQLLPRFMETTAKNQD